MYDIGGGPDKFSDISTRLKYPKGTDLNAVADEIYAGLKGFAGFNKSSRYMVIVGDGAAMFANKHMPLPAIVRLTAYDAARVLVGDTGGIHFLVGTRNWRVWQSDPDTLTVATGAIDHYWGAVNRGFLMGFHSGEQNRIWIEYLSTIVAGQADSHGASSDGFRIIERTLPK